MDEYAKRNLIARYLDAYNRFDVDGMMATVHDAVVFQNIADGVVNAQADGADALRQMAEAAIGLFASRCQTMTSFTANDDGAVITVVYEAVLASDLPNGLKAGQRLCLEGRAEFAFKDDRIVRIVDSS